MGGCNGVYCYGKLKVSLLWDLGGKVSKVRGKAVAMEVQGTLLILDRI